jgi:glycosyltransferase involved in cell wall biosynthesis
METNDSLLVSVVIPMYNEEEAIGDELTTIVETMAGSGLSYEILVVDDGSTDGSAKVVDEFASRFEEVHAIRHRYNRGVGAARSTGLKAARGEIVVMTDADGTYPDRDIPRLVRAIVDEEFDMVIGARRSEEGTLRWLRSPAKWFIRQLASYLMNIPIPDLNSGLRASRREIALGYLNILPTTHSWVSTITLAFLSDRYPVTWLPIDYFPRKGRSTFHPIADTYNYLTLVVRTVTYFRPLKVFLPIALALFTAGVVKGIYDLSFNMRLRESDLLMVTAGLLIGMMGLLADLIVAQHRLR